MALQRSFALLVWFASAGAALAQQDFSPPPMVPSDSPPPQPQPSTTVPPGYDPNQVFPMPKYSNAPLPDQPVASTPATPRPQDRQPAPEKEGFLTRRKHHFLGALTGAVGVSAATYGVVGGARLELDLGKVALLGSFDHVVSSPSALQVVVVDHFTVMGGWSFFAGEELSLRLLGGLDIMSRDGLTAFGPVVGTNLRSMWGRWGLDGAAFFTPFPYRQLELRAGVVVSLFIFELHAGWRLQVIDATAQGTLGTLFSNAPGINGPYIAVGIAI